MKTDMEKSGGNVDFIIKMSFGFIVIFLMTYGVVMSRTNAFVDDYVNHAEWAMKIEWNKLGDFLSSKVSYPLWHFGVNLCVNKLAIDTNKAAALITALFNCFAYLSILVIWNMGGGFFGYKGKDGILGNKPANSKSIVCSMV